MPFPELDHVIVNGTATEAQAAVASVRSAVDGIRTMLDNEDLPPLPTGCDTSISPSNERLICEAICEIKGIIKWLKCIIEEDPEDWADCVDDIQAEVDACCESCEAIE